MSEGFANAIVGGAETLVRTAIKSLGFVTGVFGWRIARDGTAEFNDLTARGSISAGGGNVLLNSSGLAIDGPGGQFDINGTAGFLAQNNPTDGQQMQMVPNGLFLTPEDPSPLGVAVDFASINVGYDNPGAANEAPNLVVFGVGYVGKSEPFIGMRGQAANDANPDNSTNVDISADNINLLVGASRSGFYRGEVAGFLLSFGPAASANIAVTYAKTYTNPPFPYANIDSGAGATSLCVVRCTQRTNTGFNILLFSTDATNRTFVNVPISWATFEI